MTHVRLRPVVREDFEIFEADNLTPEGTGALQWFGFRGLTGLKAQFAENGLLADDSGTLTVKADGAVAGRVSWFRSCLWGPQQTSWCWTIAIGLRPGHRGRGVGTEAQRRLAGYLFDHTRAHRVQAFTDVANLAEHRALEKAGFVREGVLRQAQWRAGRWHDQVLYAALRSEWCDTYGPDAGEG